MRIRFFLLLAVLFLCGAARAERQDYRIGVLSVDIKTNTIAKWQETANYLTRQIEGATFTVVPMSYSGRSISY